MMPMLRQLVAMAALTASALSCGAAAGWESADRVMTAAERAAVERAADADAPAEVWVRDGYVYITAQRPVTVKIFSILGQLISQETVPAGTYRLHLASRGIYILKAGTLTRRITL